MTKPTSSTVTTAILRTSFVLDLVILSIFLFMPRSGMEAMGAAFLLYPLAAIRVILAIVGMVLSVRYRRWGIGVYYLLAMAVLVWFSVVGAAMKPTYEPLYEVLRQEVRSQAKRFSEYLLKRAYDEKRAQQRRADPAHGLLCDLLADERDLQALEAHLNQDLNKPCATYHGDSVSPLLHVIHYTYGPWSGGAKAHPPLDKAFVAPAAARLLAAGADPDLQDQHGNTPLHYALTFQNEALLDELLARGACLLIRNQRDESPLSTHSAYRLRQKIDAAANDPGTLSRCPASVRQARKETKSEEPIQSPDAGLLSALRSGRLELAIAHLERGANPNAIDREGSSFDAALRNCRDNHRTLTQLLLDAGADINLQNEKGQTALKIAFYSCMDAVPFLLERGADPTIADRKGDTVLHDLVRVSPTHVEALLNQLLAAGADINRQNRSGQTPLIRAAFGSADRVIVASALLDRGAEPNLQDSRGNTALHELSNRKADAGAIPMLQALLDKSAALEIRNRMQETPLIAAIDHSSSSVVQLLIEAGADVNARRARGNPLIGSLISCEPDKLEKLTLLVKAGADTSATSEFGPLPLAQAFFNKVYLDCLEPAAVLLAARADPNLRDRNGSAAIHGIATWAEKDPEPALALLAAHGADIDLPNDQGMTTLLLAAGNGTSLRPLEQLLAHGADRNARDDEGNTLLHRAAMNHQEGNAERFAWVLANGGDLEAVNLAGQTPMDRARLVGNQVIVEAIEALKSAANDR